MKTSEKYQELREMSTLQLCASNKVTKLILFCRRAWRHSFITEMIYAFRGALISF